MAGFLNYSKAGKGVKKDDLDKSGVGLYFDIFGRRIWKFITLNLMYLVVSIPAILIAFLISSYLLTYLLHFIQQNVPGAVDVIQKTKDVVPVLVAISAIVLFQFFGSGPATASMSYILRKYVKDTHVWIFSDFFEQIKKNFKQGIIVYLINTLAYIALIVAYIFYSLMLKGPIGEVLAFVIIVVSVFFIMMQMYIYQLMAGFNFKVKDLYKNSLLLTMIKLPFNILITALIGGIMYTMYSLATKSLLIAVILLIAIYVVLINYTQIFMTNNIIKEYVLEPSLQKDAEDSRE